MQQLYTSAEAASLLGISANTVRSWLSRYPEVFQADVHMVMQNGKRLWTQAGITLLQERATQFATNGDANSDANSDAITTQSATNNIASNDVIATESAPNNVANSDAIANPTAIPPIASDEISNDIAKPASFNDALIEGFTDKLSIEIAASIAERLPGRVLHHINRMLHHNPTHKEAEILHHATQQQLQLLPGVEGKYLALPQSK